MYDWTDPQDFPRPEGHGETPIIDMANCSLQATPWLADELEPFILNQSALFDAVNQFNDLVGSVGAPASVNLDRLLSLFAAFSDAIYLSTSSKINGTLVGDLFLDLVHFLDDDERKLDLVNKQDGDTQLLVGDMVPWVTRPTKNAVHQAQASLVETLVGITQQNSSTGDPAPQHQKIDRSKVSMGIADLSIAFLNRRFMRSSGVNTRFEFLWLQGRAMLNPPPYAGALGRGTLLFRDDIDALIQRHLVNGILDEEAAYAEFSTPQMRLYDPWMQRSGHGTSVLDLMTGAEPGTMDDERPIYAVEMPTAVLADTSGDQIVPYLLAAMAQIAKWSFLVPFFRWEPVPHKLVMNASVSFTGGPNRGQGIYSKPLSDLMRCLQFLPIPRDVKLTIPAGNHLQDRIYAEIPQRTATEIDWIVPPDDRTPTKIEFHQNNGHSNVPIDLASLSITPPGQGTTTVRVLPGPGQFTDLSNAAGEIIARLYRSKSLAPSDTLTLKIRPTHDPSWAGPDSPSGIWKIAANGRRHKVQLWIRRDDALDGFAPRGRQSRFMDPTYLRFDDGGDHRRNSVGGRPPNLPVVKRNGTISALAHSRRANNGVNVVGGEEKDFPNGKTSYRFSGQNWQSVVNIVDDAEESRVAGGPLSAGRKSRSWTRLSGTSIASAIAARKIADM